MRRTSVMTVLFGGLLAALTGCSSTGGSRLPSWTDAVEPGYSAPADNNSNYNSDSACGTTLVVMAPSTAGPHIAGDNCGPLG